MDSEVMTDSAVKIERLAREIAVTHGKQLLALGADTEWENWTLLNLLMDLPQKWELSLFAKVGDDPVGYAIVSKKPESIHLHHLIIGKAHRGLGIGGKMIERLLANSKAANAVRVTLKSLESNQRAIDFYLGFGFVMGKRQPNGYINLLWRNTGE